MTTLEKMAKSGYAVSMVEFNGTGNQTVRWNQLEAQLVHEAAQGRSPKTVCLLRNVERGKDVLLKGTEYEVESIERGTLRVHAEVGMENFYDPADFVITAWHGPAKESGPLPAQGNGNAPKQKAAKGAKKAEAQTSQRPINSLAVLGPITQLGLTSIVRHPDNRQPSKDDVEARAESMQENGQLEPIVVRGLTDGEASWQLVSGETRWLAAKKLGWKTIAARCIPAAQCSDAQALELLAIANAQRQDLNPIEKARLIERLCLPIADHGAGLTREQAAKIYGMESGAAASNLVRLLELPKVWQDRVASGELPQSYARELLAINHPRLLAQADRSWKLAHSKPKTNGNRWEQEDEAENWNSRESVQQLAESIRHDFTRPIDAKTLHRHPGDQVGEWGKAADQPRLFELTDDVRKSLDIVTLTIDGKPVNVATNAEEWDRLNIPLVKAKLAGKRKGKAAAAGDDADSHAAKKLTPAEAKARKKELADRLAGNIALWRHNWLKVLCSQQFEIQTKEADDWYTVVVASLLFASDQEQRSRLNDAFEDACNKQAFSGALDDAWSAITGTLRRDENCTASSLIVNAIVALLREPDEDRRRPLLPFAWIDQLAAALKINVADAWRALWKVDGKPEIEEFLLLHTGEQLDELNAANKWGFYLDGKGKKDKLAIILATAKTLPLPKSIAGLKPAAAAGKRKKRK